MVIVIATAITYTTFSMNQITQLSETIGVQQEIRTDKTNESFTVTSVRTDNNQFNMTVKNTGDVPVHLTRLWIENTTDSSWPISKYDLDLAIAPGNTVKNIGQGIGLTALDTQSYHAQIISERGNQQEMFLNTVGDSSVFLRLTATPAVMPTTFTSTVTLEVINTGSTQLLNLQPEMKQTPLATCATTCTVLETQSATPASFDSLNPGDIAIFEWQYSFSGENGDQLEFTAGLVNDMRNDTFTVALQTIESALNADVAIESGGLGDQVLINDDILLFHQETKGTPTGEYQLWSGVGDGGGNGDRISLDQEEPHLFTNNGSGQIIIPEGNYNVAMMLKSEAVPTSLKGDGHDMIFHFEDGNNNPPVNSQDSSNRDLEECGVVNYNQLAPGSPESDAEETDGGGGDGNMNLSSTDLDFDTSTIVGVRFENINIPQASIVTSASIQFDPDASNSGTKNLRIYGEDASTAASYSSTKWDISNRVHTGNFTDWSVPTWTCCTPGPEEITPDISNIIQEIVDRGDWSSGNDMSFIFYDNGGEVNRREAETSESGGSTARLQITWGSGAVPTWEAGSGPHNSGSYHFDGTQQCFRSSNNVSGGDDNDIGDQESTTSLWFKTDGAVTNEQYLVAWEGTDYYRIGLDNVGRVFFEYETNPGDSKRCLSTNQYDDSQWYHIVARSDRDPDHCYIDIKDIDGASPEGRIQNTVNMAGSSSVDVSGKWHVASNVAEDGNFFDGYIDDIMHWDDYELSNTETDNLGRVNYGDGAYNFDLVLDLTDGDGVLVSNLYTEADVKVAFADPKCESGCDNDDTAYSQQNMTFNIPQVVVADNQRLELYFTWKDSTAIWEALEVDMKIDDTDMNDPYPSFMQIPFPSSPFPSYYVYDQDDEFRIFIANSGEDGIFLTYQGTRVNFNGTLGAFAGLIHSINGTGGGANEWWNLTEDRDSLYIPSGQIAEAWFHESTDIPSTDESGTLILPGSYRTTIWINGYSDQGETFTRSVTIGTVDVTP